MTIRRTSACLVACLSIGFLAVHGNADETKLHALLIGNSQYAAGQLRNPANDAKLLGESLQQIGFKVTVQTDLSHEAMDDAINVFSHSIPKGGLALLYYAGHGVQVDGINYLIPVDAKLGDASAVKYRTVSQNFVVDALQASDGNMKVVVLDCCRDNPFQRAWTRGTQKPGLAASMEMPVGTMIAYSTAPGETASDGKGNNSPYAIQLAAALQQTPAQGLTLTDVFTIASRAVAAEEDQHPWMNHDLSAPPVYLRPPSDALASSVKPAITPALNPTFNPSPSVLPQPVAPPSFGKAIPTQQTVPESDSLLTQARIFHNNAKFDLAIESYSALINNSVASKSIRDQARNGRARALVSRAQGNDLLKAFVDKKAVGAEGLMLPLRADSAELKVDKKVTGKMLQNQIGLVTQSNGDWLWVNSVQGDTSIRGWIKSSAFVAKPKPAPAKPKVAATPKVVSPRPAQVQPRSTQSQFSNQPQYSNQQQYSNQPRYSNQQQYSNQPQYSNQRRNFNDDHHHHYQEHSHGDSFTEQYRKRNGRPPSIWETPKWESPAEIRRLRSQGLLR